jgi:hypothetical protein
LPDSPQSYENHGRYVPGYHFLLSLILLANLGFAARQAWQLRSTDSWIGLALAVGLLMIWWYVRAFAVTVQDRVIRLEELLRYDRVLPADLRGRAEGLKKGQIIALRFAHDDELPDLVRRTIDGNLPPKSIKQDIKTWRADHLRV